MAYKIQVPRHQPLYSGLGCLISVSIGHRGFEGEKLEAILSWAAAHHSALHVCVADTLHRHDFVFQRNLSEGAAAVEARAAGEAWLAVIVQDVVP